LRRFEDTLHGVVLTGFFTVHDPQAKENPKLHPERYEIRGVTKLDSGSLWKFDTRIVYDKFDVTIPLPLPVEWAGDTSIIVVDSVTIPGLGTFDARVMIHDGTYSGTWCHGKISGHLFGMITKAEDDKKEVDAYRGAERPSSDPHRD
jgi:hypothetical protein